MTKNFIKSFSYKEDKEYKNNHIYINTSEGFFDLTQFANDLLKFKKRRK